MPQLDPNPWLAILLFSWFVFLVIIPSKVMLYNFPNEPSHTKQGLLAGAWNWPWY